MNKLQIFPITVILCLLFSLGRGCSTYPKFYEDTRAASTPGTCIEEIQCIPGFLIEENKTCVDQCPEASYVVGVAYKDYKKCLVCDKLHISSSLQYCYDSCGNEVAQDGGKLRCLATPDKCTLQLAQDRTLCGSTICKDTQTPLDVNGVQICSCPDGTPYYDMKTQTCLASCQSTQIVNPDYKVCLSSDADCYSFMTKTTKLCGTNVCLSNEYAIPNGGNTIYSICEPCPTFRPIPKSDKSNCDYCASPLLTNITTGTCLASTAECNGVNFVYTDGKRCGPECDSTEYYIQKDSYKQCITCSDHVSLDKLSCVKDCPLSDARNSYGNCFTSYTSCYNGVISVDKKSCINECPLGSFKMVTQDPYSSKTYYQCTVCDGETPYYQELGVSLSCVAKCDSSLILDVEAKACITIAKCTKLLSSDSTQCVSACSNSEYIKVDPISILTYKLCLAAIPENYYSYIQDSKKYCIQACSDSMISRASDKTCLLSKTECAQFISANSLQCTSTCDASKLETAVQMTGYKQCTVCTNLFLESDSTCITTCPDNYVAVYPANVCLQKGELSVQACSSYKMQTDGKSCDTKCKYPDILVDSSCFSPSCTTAGCDFCPKETYQLFERKQTSCSASCGYFKSSDGLKCVQHCKIIFEVTLGDATTCIACGADEIFLSNSSGGECKTKASTTVQNKIDSLSNVLSRAIENQTVLNNLQGSLSDFVKSVGSTVSSASNNQELLTNIETLGQAFINSIVGGLQLTSSSEEAATLPYSFGSKTTVLAVVQKLKPGRKMKSSISLSSILGDTAPDLTEVNSGNSVVYSTIVSSVIVNNPSCSISDCQFPVVNVQAQSNIFMLRMLSAETTLVNVDFPVTKTSQLYICVSIDLQTNKANTKDFTVPTINGLVVTCAVNGPTSLYLDSTCIYLDKSKCAAANGGPNSNTNDEDDGLSDGGIAGIVIGSVGFAGIVAAGGFFLYKRMLKIKGEQNKAKYVQTQAVSDH